MRVDIKKHDDQLAKGQIRYDESNNYILVVLIDDTPGEERWNGVVLSNEKTFGEMAYDTSPRQGRIRDDFPYTANNSVLTIYY